VRDGLSSRDPLLRRFCLCVEVCNAWTFNFSSSMRLCSVMLRSGQLSVLVIGIVAFVKFKNI
jgi:hypothetical protein